MDDEQEGAGRPHVPQPEASGLYLGTAPTLVQRLERLERESAQRTDVLRGLEAALTRLVSASPEEITLNVVATLSDRIIALEDAGRAAAKAGIDALRSEVMEQIGQISGQGRIEAIEANVRRLGDEANLRDRSMGLLLEERVREVMDALAIVREQQSAVAAALAAQARRERELEEGLIEAVETRLVDLHERQMVIIEDIAAQLRKVEATAAAIYGAGASTSPPGTVVDLPMDRPALRVVEVPKEGEPNPSTDPPPADDAQFQLGSASGPFAIPDPPGLAVTHQERHSPVRQPRKSVRGKAGWLVLTVIGVVAAGIVAIGAVILTGKDGQHGFISTGIGARAVKPAVAPKPAVVAPPDPKVAYDRAKALLASNDTRAIAELMHVAAQGYPPAQYDLSQIYETGTAGLPQDGVQARVWLERASDAGSPQATYQLALADFNGRNCAVDLPRAAKEFARAAEAGLAPAQYGLGQIYEHGSGLAPDKALAYQWYLIAARSGDEKAKQAATHLARSLPAEARQMAQSAAEAFQPRGDSAPHSDASSPHDAPASPQPAPAVPPVVKAG